MEVAARRKCNVVREDVMSDYQVFDLVEDGLTNVGERMQKKMHAIPMPDLTGKSVLDIGCDFGFWCWFAILNGASSVTGLDRNRTVRNVGFVDLIESNRDRAKLHGWQDKSSFHRLEMGSQYRDIGRHDVAFCFSMYHHAYACAGGDHAPLWFWMRRQLKPGGTLLWENPVDSRDPVVQANVPSEYHEDYNIDSILFAASKYFTFEKIGPALHEPYREVYKFTANPGYRAQVVSFYEPGSSGAKKAFEYADGRRMKEIEHIVGVKTYPGSLNVRTLVGFPWDENYFRAQMMDVADRHKGLESEWVSRWARFYPLKAKGEQAWAFRFEDEEYAENFVEIVSERRIDVDNVYVLKNPFNSNWFNKKTGKQVAEVPLELEK